MILYQSTFNSANFDIMFFTCSHGEGGGGGLSDLKFGAFIGHFPSDGAASNAVKGLNIFNYKSRIIAHHHWATILELLSKQKRRVDVTNRNTEKFVSALLSSTCHLTLIQILFRLGRWWEQLQTCDISSSPICARITRLLIFNSRQGNVWT